MNRSDRNIRLPFLFFIQTDRRKDVYYNTIATRTHTELRDTTSVVVVRVGVTWIGMLGWSVKVSMPTGSQAHNPTHWVHDGVMSGYVCWIGLVV